MQTQYALINITKSDYIYMTHRINFEIRFVFHENKEKE